MKIFAIGRNYAAHAKEMNSPVPEEPVIFMKPPTALLTKGKPFFYPDFTKEIHYEAEIVIRICKQGKHIQEKFAHKYYDQVTLGLDMTARDIQKRCKEKGLPWELAKGFDQSAVVGEFIPTSEIEDLSKMQFTLEKNGAVVQSGDQQNMLFSIHQIIVFLSGYYTLQNGDLIFTGTPEGVGPIAIGDHFSGKLHGRELLQCEIR